MDRVQRDQCRLLINLSEFQIHRLAPGEVGEEGKRSEVSAAGAGLDLRACSLQGEF